MTVDCSKGEGVPRLGGEEGEGNLQEEVQAKVGKPKWTGVAQRHTGEGTSPSPTHYPSRKVTSHSSDNKHSNMF